MKTIHLGAGAGYSGDRIEPAVELAEKGDIQYLVFECLAERTIALAQAAKLKDPALGYDPLLAARMKAVLAPCRARGIRIITNMGAANPVAAAEKTMEIARAMGLKGLQIAAVTGGYFADPGYKDVPDIARVGFPIAAVAEDGSAVITKVPGSGGMVTRATCTEQLLYEIHDPTRYYQPDVVADFSKVTLTEDGRDRVRVAGAAGTPKTGTLKVTVGYLDSYLGEGQISYAGPGALARGRLALEILEERLESTGIRCREVRGELIGVDAILGPKLSSRDGQPNEVRVRLSARTDNLDHAILLGNEVEALYLNGPAGGGGARSWAREIIGVVSVLIPEQLAQPAVHRMES